MATKKKTKSKMTDEHKEALAIGRTEGRAVRAYLEALEAHKPKRGRKRTTATISNRLAAIEAALDEATGIDRLHFLQEQTDLEAELASLAAENNLPELEAAFNEAAAGYSARKGISYDTWRKMGIAAATLKAAGVTR